MKTKMCTKCKIEKPLSEFHKDKWSKDSFTNRCKTCFRNYQLKNWNKLSTYRKEHWKKYYKLHKQTLKRNYKLYRKNNRNKINQLNKFYYDNNLNFKIAKLLRNRMGRALKRITKLGHTLELIGCSIEFFKQHLESQFKDGMSWSNYGKWEIDHIIPCASFNLSNSNEQKKCFNYKNLQPLWWEENRTKHAKT
jgi:hypothetical protein